MIADILSGKGYFVLIDPDRQTPSEAGGLAKLAEENGADAVMIGSSIILEGTLDETVQEIKKTSKLPVILFPGASAHLSEYADGVFFMSLLSGRNPDFLITEQVKAAPAIYRSGLEAIPMAYLLVSSGKMTSVEFMSNTKPLPADKPDIAVAHALAAKYLGMKVIYLEAGSGAKESIPETLIAAIRKYVDLPIIVGGGIRDPKVAAGKIRAGANFVVTGTAIEKDPKVMQEFAKAIKNC